MRPSEKSFEEWRLLFLSSPKNSDVWWQALDNMAHTAQYSEDWSEYSRILEYEEFPSWHPEKIIATNGILFAKHLQVNIEQHAWRRKFNCLPSWFIPQNVSK